MKCKVRLSLLFAVHFGGFALLLLLLHTLHRARILTLKFLSFLAHKLALHDLGKAIAIHPVGADNYYLRGDCHSKLGNYEQVCMRLESYQSSIVYSTFNLISDLLQYLIFLSLFCWQHNRRCRITTLRKRIASTTSAPYTLRVVRCGACWVVARRPPTTFDSHMTYWTREIRWVRLIVAFSSVNKFAQ